MPRDKMMHTFDIPRALLFSVDLTGPKLLKLSPINFMAVPGLLRCHVMSSQGTRVHHSMSPPIAPYLP